MPVSRRLRYEVLRRDNHACRYCGASAPDVPLTVDHVIPIALGGTDDPSNLVTACQPCNAGKSASSPDAPIVDDVAADALRWSKAMTRAAEITRADLKARMERCAVFLNQIWRDWDYEYRGKVYSFDLPPDWEDTIDRFFTLGVSEEDFIEAVRITMRNKARDHFTYMCGVLWNMVRERQQIAMQIVKGETADDGS